MRNSIISILFIVKLASAFAQIDSIKTAELDSMYLQTIRNQFELMLSSGYKYFKVDQNTERIKDKVSIDIFKFMTKGDLINTSIRKKKTITVYCLTHQIISSDTVDINISDASLTAKRVLWKKKVQIEVSCGGTNGYVPTARFVYNTSTMTWDKVEFVKTRTVRTRPKNSGL